MNYEFLFFKGLLATILIETIVLILFVRLLLKNKDISLIRLLGTGLFTSFATLPYLWFILPYFVSEQMAYIISGESFAVIMETFILSLFLRTKIGTSFLISLTCNAISFSIGLLLF